LKVTNPKNIYNAETGLCFRLPLNKMVSLIVDGGKNSKERIAVLLACNADETIRLHHYSLGRTENHIVLKISEVAHKICNKQKSMGYTSHCYCLSKGIKY
jgi:hypothetical protein